MKIFMNNKEWELDCVYFCESVKKVAYEFISSIDFEEFTFMIDTKESFEDVLKINNAYIIKNKEGV